MMAGISREQLSIPRAVLTGISGAAAAAGTRLMQVVGALGIFGQIAGTLVGAKLVLDLFFDSAIKETEELKKQTEVLTEATKTAVDVFKKYGDETTVAELSAKSKAVDGIAQSLKELPKVLEEQQKNQGAWSKFWDNLLPTALGGSVRSNAIQGFSKTILAAINDAATPELKAQAEEKLKDILEIKGDISEKNVTDKLDHANRATMESVNGLVDNINKANKKIAAPGEDVADKYKKLEKAFTDLSNTFISNDPGTKYALAMIAQMNSLATALNEPTAKLAQLREIANDVRKIDLLPANVQDEFREATAEFQKLETQLKQAKQEQAAAEAVIQKGKQKALDIAFKGGNANNYASSASIIADGQKQLNEALDKQKAILAEEKELSDKTVIKMSHGMETAIKFIEGPLVRAIENASINYQKALLSTLPRTETTVNLTYKLELESINVRKKEIEALGELAFETRIARLSAEKRNLETKLEEETGGGGFKLIGEKRTAAKTRLGQISDELDANTGKKTASQFDAEGKLTDNIANIISERLGVKVKLAELGGQANQAYVTKETTLIAARYDQLKITAEAELQKIQAENKQFLSSTEFAAIATTEERDREIAKRTAQEVAQQNKIAQLPMEQRIAQGNRVVEISKQAGFGGVAEAGREAIRYGERDLFNLKEVQRLTAQTAVNDAERKTINDALALSTEKVNTKLVNDKELGILAVDNALKTVEEKQKELQINKDNSTISEFTYSIETNKLTVLTAQLDRAKSMLEENTKYQTEYNSLVVAQKKSNTYQTEEDKLARERLDDNHNNALQGIDDQYNARKKLADLEAIAQNEKSKREQAYSQVFENGINSITDAFVEFTKTGKLSFKSLIDDMIAGLIRYELKQQMMALYNGPGGLGGSAGIIGAAKEFFGFGGSGAGTGPKTSQSSIADQAATTAFGAKGFAWENGMQKFAMGGIVNQPTLFKYAHGTGLMGEAGPEAIMPLRRDGAGNLGVINGGGGKVDVVVNNYGNQQATTKETTDAKGNRKIEVIIGDMVADQIGKTGSSAQQAMTTNYGNRPTLVRR